MHTTYLQQLRKKYHYTQEHLAHVLGMARPTYLTIEKGERELSVSEARTLSELYGLTLEQLVREQMPEEVDILPSSSASTTDMQMRISVPQERVEKFKEVLLYILQTVGAKPNVGETVIYKLLYFIDFDYYERYEEQLIGATYIKNTHGPTPKLFKKIVDDMIRDGEVERVTSKFYKYEQKKYLPLRHPNLTLLNAQELFMIDEVLARLSDRTATELSNYSHEDVPWKAHHIGEVIDYESVFYRNDPYSVREEVDEI